jgi:hypothetical protein
MPLRIFDAIHAFVAMRRPGNRLHGIKESRMAGRRFPNLVSGILLPSLR